MSKKSHEVLYDLIVEGQGDNGFWKPGGQLPNQKRPKKETTEVSAMWALLALGKSGQGNLLNKNCQAILAPLRDAKPGRSTEWYGLRLLLEHQFGSSEHVGKWRAALLVRQNVDGGWSWVQGDASDALATGQALYALGSTGLDGTNDSIGRAWRFLLQTQKKNGFWLVHSTKQDKRHKAVETSIFWGTAWAIMGLARTLPK